MGRAGPGSLGEGLLCHGSVCLLSRGDSTKKPCNDSKCVTVEISNLLFIPLQISRRQLITGKGTIT